MTVRDTQKHAKPGQEDKSTPGKLPAPEEHPALDLWESGRDLPLPTQGFGTTHAWEMAAGLLELEKAPRQSFLEELW